MKSNFIGFIFLSFLFFNWKPLFILVFSDYDVLVRLAHFEGLTSSRSLVWYPVALGILAAVFSPWINLLGAYAVRLPVRLLSEINEDEMSRRKIRLMVRETDESVAKAAAEKAAAEKEAAKAAREAAEEEREIDAAKRMDNAKKIESPEIRAKLEEKLEANRSLNEGKEDGSETLRRLRTSDLNILKEIGKTREGLIRLKAFGNKYGLVIGSEEQEGLDRKTYLALKDILNNLVAYGVIEKPGSDGEQFMTALGYQVLSAAEKEKTGA